MGRHKILQRASSTAQFKSFVITTLFSQNAESLNDMARKVKIGINKPHYLNTIERLKYTSAAAQSAVLSCTQLSQPINMFVMNMKIEGAQKWIDKSFTNPEDFTCVINGKIKNADSPVLSKQQSVSFPFIHADICRYNRIQVQYQNIEGQTLNQQLTGYQAFAFQQAVDYSFGMHLMDWRLHLGHLTVQADVQKSLFKTTSVIEQYSNELKSMLHKFPHLSQVPEKIDEKNLEWFQTRGCKEKISIEGDYMLRIYKHYKKQMALLLQRMELNIKT